MNRGTFVTLFPTTLCKDYADLYKQLVRFWRCCMLSILHLFLNICSIQTLAKLDRISSVTVYGEEADGCMFTQSIYIMFRPRGAEGRVPPHFFWSWVHMLCKCRHSPSHNAFLIRNRKWPQLISNAAASGNLKITIKSLPTVWTC